MRYSPAPVAASARAGQRLAQIAPMTFDASADRIRPELQVRSGLVVFFEGDLADRVSQDLGLL